MAASVERERSVDIEIQFERALSPPLLLMLAVLLADRVELALRMQVQMAGALSRTRLGYAQTLLLYRSISFAIFPLSAAIHVLRRGGARLTRVTMRGPSHVQCV